MKKKKLLSTLFIAATLWTAQAMAAESTPTKTYTVDGAPGNFYVAARAGLAVAPDAELSGSGYSLDTSFDSGMVVSIATGRAMGGFRFETELGYQKNDLSSLSGYGVTVPIGGDLSIWSLMANFIYDFDTGTSMKPYVMAGAGMATATLNNPSVRVGNTTYTGGDVDDTVPALQAGVGVGFDVNPNLVLDIGYRYFAPAVMKASGVELDFVSHNITVGARIKF